MWNLASEWLADSPPSLQHRHIFTHKSCPGAAITPSRSLSNTPSMNYSVRARLLPHINNSPASPPFNLALPSGDFITCPDYCTSKRNDHVNSTQVIPPPEGSAVFKKGKNDINSENKLLSDSQYLILCSFTAAVVRTVKSSLNRHGQTTAWGL